MGRIGTTSTEFALALGGIVLFGCLLLLSGNDAFGYMGLTIALGLYAANSFIAWLGARQEKLQSFGVANAVTLVRFALASILAGCAVEIAANEIPPSQAAIWLITAIALLALGTDACDGWLARRLRTQSSFGACFDMETDAVLILVLSVLVWILDKAGAWILAAGLIRYLFVAAGLRWPFLANPLPPSMRRKFVCALQTSALIVMLAPAVPPAVSTPIGLAALAALIWSFAVDIAHLILATPRPQLTA